MKVNDVNHLCYFHKQQIITKFCTAKQCTLPLCEICEKLHLKEHISKPTNPQIITINQANRVAVKQLQRILQNKNTQRNQHLKTIYQKQKQLQLIIQSILQQDKQTINQYFNDIDIISKKLQKIKKGSLKHLIYFYTQKNKEAQNIKLEELRIHQITKSIQQIISELNHNPIKNIQQQIYKYSYNNRINIIKEQMESQNLTAKQNSFYKNNQTVKKQIWHKTNYQSLKNFKQSSSNTPRKQLKQVLQKKYKYSSTNLIKDQQQNKSNNDKEIEKKKYFTIPKKTRQQSQIKPLTQTNEEKLNKIRMKHNRVMTEKKVNENSKQNGEKNFENIKSTKHNRQNWKEQQFINKLSLKYDLK